MVYGYVRVSTAKQDPQRQIRNILRQYPDAVIYQETYTGTKIEGRTQLNKLLKKVQPKDSIVFDEVSRMSRNAEDGITLYRDLFNKNVNLIFIKEPQINTSTYRRAMEKTINVRVSTGSTATDEFMEKIITAINEYVMALAAEQIKLAFDQAQAEVDYLHQRTKEGIETARREGKQIGMKPGAHYETKKSKKKKKEILKYAKAFGGALTDADTMRLIHISRNTYYKYKRELLQQSSACADENEQ